MTSVDVSKQTWGQNEGPPGTGDLGPVQCTPGIPALLGAVATGAQCPVWVCAAGSARCPTRAHASAQCLVPMGQAQCSTWCAGAGPSPAADCEISLPGGCASIASARHCRVNKYPEEIFYSYNTVRLLLIFE